MLTSYIRSSSYGNWDVCPQQYFINYILGQPRQANLKADKGTITHKVLEILAIAKQYYDIGSQYISFVDDCVGEVSFHRDEFLTPYMLHSTEVDKINTSRADKKVYISPCKLEYGHTRYGYDIVENLCQRVFNFYITKNGWNNWTSQDYKDCENWVWMAVDYENGMFDPRKRKIVSPESAFDFPIEADWAKFKDPNGQEQYLRIKGTIDLITEIEPGTYQIIDWKSGRRQNFATGEEKTYGKLCKDPQLMLYYYAARQLFPLVDNILLTIFFIRDGGPFTVYFDDKTMSEMEKLLKDRVHEIWACTTPKLVSETQTSFKCTFLCDYYKNKWPGTDTNICKHIQKKIQEEGIDHVTKTCTYDGHSHDKYNAPGGV